MPSRQRAPEQWPAAALDAILDAIPARITWWDRELGLRYSNAAAERELFGRPLAETRGRRMPDLVPWFVGRDAQYIRAALGGQDSSYYHRRAMPAGTVAHRKLYVLADRDAPGTAADGVFVVSVDITARMLAEDAAHANEQLAAVLQDRRRVAADLHPAVFACCRAAVEQLARMLTEDPAPEPARQAAIDRIDEAMAALRGTIRTLRHGELARSDPRRPAQPSRFLASRSRHAQDRPASGLGTAQLLRVLDALPMMVTGWDGEHRNAFANRAAVSGYRAASRAAVLGRRARDLAGPGLDGGVSIVQAAGDGVDQQVARAVRMPDGRSRHSQVDYVTGPVPGTTIDALAFVLDITEQIEAEAAQRHSAERLERLQDRVRLATQLHDQVIQRLFAAGLALVVRRDGVNREAIATAVVGIDDALAHLGASLDLDPEPAAGRRVGSSIS